jgi:hypothetical protein
VRKVRIILIVVLALAVLVGLGLFAFEYFQPKGAGVFIETDPESIVYIDGERVGRTPYKETLEAQDIILKLVPESFEVPLVPYETKISLTPGVETVVRRYFGETEEISSGETISFEEAEKDETSLVVVSVPDNAQVYIDGEISGFAPHKTTSIIPGEHTLRLSAAGYEDKNLIVNTREGYKLTVVVKLAFIGEEVQEEVVEKTVEKEQEKVIIDDTPTGFLRVREEPSTLSQEIAQVKPGETYNLLETDEETGWYKIELEDGESGWVSNNYADLTEKDTQEATGSGETQ